MQALYANASFDPTIAIVLAGQRTFVHGDPYSIAKDSNNEVDPVLLLPKFNAWRLANAAAYDNAQLLTGFDLKASAVGYAYVGAMCVSVSGDPRGGSCGVDSTYGNAPDAFHAVRLRALCLLILYWL